MDRTNFKNFKSLAEQNINKTGFMGYAWIDLTERQTNQMCDIAEQQGMKPDAEGWYSLENGIRFTRTK